MARMDRPRAGCLQRGANSVPPEHRTLSPGGAWGISGTTAEHTVSTAHGARGGISCTVALPHPSPTRSPEVPGTGTPRFIQLPWGTSLPWDVRPSGAQRQPGHGAP